MLSCEHLVPVHEQGMREYINYKQPRYGDTALHRAAVAPSMLSK